MWPSEEQSQFTCIHARTASKYALTGPVEGTEFTGPLLCFWEAYSVIRIKMHFHEKDVLTNVI